MARRRRRSNADPVALLVKWIGKVIASVVVGAFSTNRELKRLQASASKRAAAVKPTPPGDYHQEVVGEASYQKALQRVAGKGEVRHCCSAVLHPENDNEYDAQAVRVTIDGLTVGYLSKTDARRYRRSRGGVAVQSPAMIVGGGRGRSLGVWLAFDI